jgi:hypothetical protein
MHGPKIGARSAGFLRFLQRRRRNLDQLAFI